MVDNFAIVPDGAAQSGRLQALDRFDILDTPREQPFDRIVRLIQTIFDVPIGIVSMIDGHRQWYKACSGMRNTETDLQNTFCRFTLEGPAPLIIPDALRTATTGVDND